MIINDDCLSVMKKMDSDSVDLIVTDPPYGYSFMGKNWDKAVPSVEIWKECLRVLKPGGLCFVMSAPRQDVLSQMITRLGGNESRCCNAEVTKDFTCKKCKKHCEKVGAGFRTDFTSLYWTYASGFPKASNIGKMVDKRLGMEREVIEIKERKGNPINTQGKNGERNRRPWMEKQIEKYGKLVDIKTAPASDQAKALDGSYGGFQPKPAVEVIIVCMKPLSEKTYVDQALKNRKGITWLDDCKIPYESEGDKWKYKDGVGGKNPFGTFTKDLKKPEQSNPQGRFSANLLVSDDVLNDGKVTKSTKDKKSYQGNEGTSAFADKQVNRVQRGDSGSFSRYFDLDKWADQLPFLLVAKASKSEKNKGCEGLSKKKTERYGDRGQGHLPQQTPPKHTPEQNHHPTVKPLKLMSYLVTLGSREGDVVLDPFMGSGTTGITCLNLKRKFIGIELSKEYYDIALARMMYALTSKDG